MDEKDLKSADLEAKLAKLEELLRVKDMVLTNAQQAFRNDMGVIFAKLAKAIEALREAEELIVCAESVLSSHYLTKERQLQLHAFNNRVKDRKSRKTLAEIEGEK